jgi:hypothetical protein
MQGAVKRGSLDTLALMLKCRASEIRTLGDTTDIMTLENIERSLAKGREIEAVHGTGCTFDRENKSILGCIARGLIPESYRRRTDTETSIKARASTYSMPKHRSPHRLGRFLDPQLFCRSHPRRCSFRHSRTQGKPSGMSASP